jgi:DNA-binding MarR family transcriptional regulator
VVRGRSLADEFPLPGLLRHARATYGLAMRTALDAAGFGDLPRNGLYVIAGLAMENNVTGLAMSEGAVPLAEIIRQLRVSKQAAGHLVDTLVVRGYLHRAPDAHDRRRLTVALTERGRAAAKVQKAARSEIDAQLLARVGAAALRQTRSTLIALIEMSPWPGPGADDE